MREIYFNVSEAGCQESPVLIGYEGENEVTRVNVDYSEWIEEFGSGSLALEVMRSGDTAPYLATLTKEGDSTYWLVSNVDTGARGTGAAGFVYTVGNQIKKSAVFRFFVGPDVGGTPGERPDPYESLISYIERLLARTEENAAAAAESAQDAADEAGKAETARRAVEDLGVTAHEDPNGPSVEKIVDPDTGAVTLDFGFIPGGVSSVNGQTDAVTLDLDDIPNGAQYVRTTPAQVQQISTNEEDISAINAKIPANASEANKLTDESRVNAIANAKLSFYRTAAAQDSIDAGKQSKITASGILKGNGSGSVSAAVAGTDYATPQQVDAKYTKPADGIPSTDMTSAVQASLQKADTALQSAPVTSVNGQTGDVTIQPATDAQVTTAVNTWLGENVAQETGYVLDDSLTMSNAAPPASAVGDLKSAFTHNIADTGKSVGDFSKILTKTSNAVTNNRDGTYTLGTSDYGTIIFGTVMKLPAGTYMLYGVPTGFSFLSTETNVQTAFETNYSSDSKEICLTEEKTCYLGYRNTVRPSASFTITPYLIGNRIYFNEKDIDELESKITFEKYGTAEDISNHYINENGNEVNSANSGLTKRYYNYMQDGLLSVEVSAPYYFYAYGWKRSKILGSLHADGTFSTTGNALLLNKINLADYPNITFKFALRHLVNGSPVEVPLDDAVKFKFTFRNNSDISRRRISVMGDSISSFTGYTTAGSPDAYYPLTVARVYYVQNMYWKCLADRNGMVIDTIDAYPGSTVADKWQNEPRVPFYDDSRINSLGTPDVIIVEGGINDFGGNPLGDYPAIGDYSKTYEFRTAYSLLLNKLKTKYDRATIICLSMASPRTYNNTTFPEKQTEVKQALATDTTPHTFAEFNESIEHIAKQYQCAYCDITDLLDYYLNPQSQLGPHWFFDIHMAVAYRIEQKLKEIYA